MLNTLIHHCSREEFLLYKKPYYVWGRFEFGLDGSLTKILLPDELEASYNSDQVSGRVFIQISGCGAHVKTRLCTSIPSRT